MPVVYKLKRRHSHIIVWEVTESNEELLEMLQLSEERRKAYDSLSEKRKREFLGIRACFHYLQLEGEIRYLPSGKPYIKSNHHISISHSWGKVAFIISKFAVGIDIEKSRPEKILNIRHKFVREDEEAFIEKKHETDYLHIIWGAKESLYKLHDGGLESFLQHYKIEKFRFNYDQKIVCEIIDEEHHTQFYTAHYDRIKDGFYLVYVLDNIL